MYFFFFSYIKFLESNYSGTIEQVRTCYIEKNNFSLFSSRTTIIPHNNNYDAVSSFFFNVSSYLGAAIHIASPSAILTITDPFLRIVLIKYMT